LDQLIKFVNNLNTAQRAVIIGGVSLLFIILVGFLVYSSVNSQDSKLKYTIANHLTKNQVMDAGNDLESSNIPFAVIGSGDDLTLRTSKAFINIAKIKLVTSEASTSKHVGWEIFSKSSLGTTNFENKIKYLRALEGELSRSLESLTGVLQADVSIAIPKDTLFTEHKAKPTASAVLTLRPGVFLTQKQIEGITSFIASSVPNLDTKHIELINQNGTKLEQSKEEVNNLRYNEQNKYKEGIEKRYEDKIVSLLEPFVGKGRVVARVLVDLDFTKRDISQEIYAPDGTIRSQQTSEVAKNSSEKKPQKGGVPGVQSNIENPDSEKIVGPLKKTSSDATKNITNYEISKKIIKQKDSAYATIKKVSTAVTFDSSVLKNNPNKAQILASIKNVVEDTVGFDSKRGDQLSVKSFKFLRANSSAKQGTDENGNLITSSANTFALVKSFFKEFGEYFQYLIAAILLFIFYKKFISKQDILLMPSGKNPSKRPLAEDEKLDMNEVVIADEFDVEASQDRLKAKIKSQIMNNITGLDEESAAKYEILVEELEKNVNNNPQDMAEMIELLMAEGTKKPAKGKR